MHDSLAIPEILRPAITDWWAEFVSRHGSGVEQCGFAADIRRTAAASEFCAGVLLRDWPSLSLDSEFQLARLQRACEALENATPNEVSIGLRRLRRQAHCHLVFDELAERVTTERTLEKVSAVAELLLTTGLEASRKQVAVRHGTLRDTSGEAIPLLVLGMGKLGGRELNFSSDVDLIFVYPREGCSDGDRQLAAMPYCTKWSQQFVAMIDAMTEEGFVYRVDTRLRPFGDSGPPVASYASLESYLLNHGRAWERYAYLKARALGMELPDASTLFDELISPFVYRGYLDYGLLDSLRDIHGRINADQRGMQDNVKLGPGGIREIEFIVQSIQLLRGGVDPGLKTRSLLTALRQLNNSQELPDDAAATLGEHYLFLRKLENFIQARRDQQTHDLPAQSEDRAALALAMGFANWASLAQAIASVRQQVVTQFRTFAYRGSEELDALSVAFRDGAPLSDLKAELSRRGFENAEALAGQLAEFRESCARQRLADDGMERVVSLVPKLIDALREMPNRRQTLMRMLKILDNVLRRSAYISLLNENEASLQYLLRLISQSKYIADQVALFPALLDELLDPRLQKKSFTREELSRRLNSRLSELDNDDAEGRVERLARFQRHSLFQIAVCDVTENLSLMQTSDALTWLAESVLDAALDEARADVESKFGHPEFELDGRRERAEFAIVAYGKLGGLELSYGSDLDLVFLHDSRGDKQVTSGPRVVDNGLYFARLVRRLLHILTTRTSSGVVYEIDTRLRPSGRSGLLVSGIEAFERYQRDDAWTWEHQSLLRARAVVGGPALIAEFERLRQRTLCNYVHHDSLLSDVRSMRRKMKAELDQSTRQRFDLKQGDGGVADLEFIVQYLCLREARRTPTVTDYSDNIRQIESLIKAGVLAADTGEELTSIYRRYRHALHRRVLDAKDRRVERTHFQEERDAVIEAWEALLV